MNFTLSIGGAEAAGFFKEATGFDSESEVAEIRAGSANSQREGIEPDSSIRGDVTSQRHASLLEVLSR